MTDEELKHSILSNYDFAFKIDWSNEQHKDVYRYLTSLTIYFGVKMNGHIGQAGSFLAYRFNQRKDIEQKVEIYRNLFKNESAETFSEEFCSGCYIFTF